MIRLSGLYTNNKTQEVYVVVNNAINATNAQDGQAMVVYTPKSTLNIVTRKLYVRELEEFKSKFTLKE